MDSNQFQQDSTYDVALITVCVDLDDANRIAESVERMPWAVAFSSFDAYINASRRPYFSASISAAKACVAVVDFDLDPAQAIESTKYLQQVFAGRVTIIALAESRDPDILLRAMRAGCSEFLAKTISCRRVGPGSSATSAALVNFSGSEWTRRKDPELPRC